MGKTNFTKVEKALEEGLSKMTAQQLWDMAATASKKSPKSMPSQNICLAIIQNVDRDLRKLQKKDPNLYKKIGFQRQNLKKLIVSPDLITPGEWKQIQAIRSRVEKYKKDLTATLPHQSDEEIVEEARVKNVNERFNKKKHWLPLK